MDLFDSQGAEFSPCRKYRYCLYRKWDDTKPFVMFIGLNPSTANEQQNDRTITTVVGYAIRWGYGGVYMMNLFSYVSTDPDNLVVENDPTKGNNEWLLKIGSKCEKIIAAWGRFGFTERENEVKKMFPEFYALRINNDGSPHHPLYLPKDITPVLFHKNENFINGFSAH